MTASREFRQEIQERLGDSATEEDAIKACEWFDSIKPIDPSYGVGDVRSYFRAMALEQMGIAEDDWPVFGDVGEKENALWAQMYKEVFGVEV